MAASLCPALRDAQSALAGLRQWPGLLDIAAAVTSAFPQSESAAEACQLLPHIADRSDGAARRHLLPPAGRLVLASLLPGEQRREWRCLFNSDLHGKSFATLCGRAFDRGATLLVV